MTLTKSGFFAWAGGGKNGASVDMWLASRFIAPPAEGATPPSGTADAGPVVTSIAFGGPGAYTLNPPVVADYYVRAVYNGVAYWGFCPAGSIGGNPNAQGFESAVINTVGGVLTGNTVTLFQGDATVFACAVPTAPPNGTPITFINQSTASDPIAMLSDGGDTIDLFGSVVTEVVIPYLSSISVVYFASGAVWQVTQIGMSTAVVGTTTTAEGAPTTGSYVAGNEVRVTDPTEAGSGGSKYIVVGYCCTVGGIPGTWVQERYLTGN